MSNNPRAKATSVKMHRLSSSGIPSFPELTEPLEIRSALREDAEELSNLCGRAYVGEVWNTSSTELELFDDTSVKAVLVVTNRKRLVSTASLQVHADDAFSGQLRWVATEHDMRRNGLARLLVVRLLEVAQSEGCKDVFLKTTSDATGAISLYLQLGFKPMISCDSERRTWMEVFRAIGVKPQF